MGGQSKKKEPHDELFLVRLDAAGRPRGARFAKLKDNIASAAVDMKCRVLVSQPRSVSAWGMKLPVGRLRRGKLVMPGIRRDLYDTILEVARIAAEQDKAEMEAGAAEQSAFIKRLLDEADAALAQVRGVSPMTSALPRSWEEIAVGHMVLVHESPADGWWEATVLKREGEILTLHFRGYPKQPTFIRHINAVALVNPGPN